MLKTFAAGAVLYPCVELLWRGRTHPAMALAGGLGLCWLKGVNRSMAHWPLWTAALAGGAGITAMEYGLGKLVNRNYTIWDYRKQPGNVQGQICPAFALAWCGLSFLAMGGIRLLKKHS